MSDTKFVSYSDRELNNVLLILVLVFYCSLISTKLNKTTCKTESALPYSSDARALLAHGALYTSRSWKNTVLRFSKFLQCKASCVIQACTCAVVQQWIFSDNYRLTGLQACLRIQLDSHRLLQVYLKNCAY